MVYHDKEHAGLDMYFYQSLKCRVLICMMIEVEVCVMVHFQSLNELTGMSYTVRLT